VAEAAGGKRSRDAEWSPVKDLEIGPESELITPMSTQPTFDLPLKPSPVYGDDIIDEGGKTVVILFGDADSEETSAQRDLIVRAVNSYADMLSALKAAEPLLKKLCSVALNSAISEHMPFGLVDEVKEWLKTSTAEAAIRKAEGRQ